MNTWFGLNLKWKRNNPFYPDDQNACQNVKAFKCLERASLVNSLQHIVAIACKD